MLALAAVVSALQLSFDDPAWFCSPSVVGWGWTLAGFALFAGCVWTQMLLAGRVIGVWTNSRGMPFRPDWRLPALAVGVFIVLLLTYPVTTIWLDYRVMTALLYGLPALLCVLFLLLTAVRFLWHTRCGLIGKLIALVYPDYEAVDSYGISNEDLPVALEEVRQNLNKNVSPYEQITAIQLYPTEFEKTPKKSIKRYLYDR